MKNVYVLFPLILVLSSFLLADDHKVSIESDGSVAEFNYFTVTDPIDFMNSLDKFDKSECASRWREDSGAEVSLWSLRGSRSTHFVLVNYSSWDMMEKGSAIFSSCAESANMIKTFKDNTDTSRSWNWISENVFAGRAWQANTVFRKINFKVDMGAEAQYAKAWKKLMETQMDNIPGSFGLNSIPYGNRYSSHMVYLGANSMSELSDGFLTVINSSDFAEFDTSTSQIRSIVSNELVQLVKAYDGK